MCSVFCAPVDTCVFADALTEDCSTLTGITNILLTGDFACSLTGEIRSLTFLTLVWVILIFLLEVWICIFFRSSYLFLHLVKNQSKKHANLKKKTEKINIFVRLNIFFVFLYVSRCVNGWGINFSGHFPVSVGLGCRKTFDTWKSWKNGPFVSSYFLREIWNSCFEVTFSINVTLNYILRAEFVV